MYRLATEPRGIGQVLDSVFRLFRASFAALLPFAVIGALVSLTPIVYLFVTGALANPQVALGSSFGIGYWSSVLLTMPLTFIVLGAAILRGESVAQGRQIGFGTAARAAARRVVAMILGTVSYVLVVGLGLVLLVVPGMILMVSLYLFLPAIVLDGKGIVESLNYSHKLVWGNWWRTTAIATIALIIIYLLYVVVGIAASFIVIAGGTDAATLFLLQTTVTLVGGLLVTPFFVSLYLEIYRDLKMRKHGSDLAARIESVGT